MIAVLVALAAVVILGVAALALDSSHVEGTAQQLQAAADAAALAAASILSEESAAAGGTYPETRAAAVSVAAGNKAAAASVQVDANTGNAASGDVVVGRWNGATASFTPTTASPNAVKVVARRTNGSSGGALSLIFGGMVGVTHADVSRSAIATCTPGAVPFVHVLDPSASAALSLTGNAELGALGGRVQVDSSAGSAITATGNARIAADQTSVVGDASLTGNASIDNLHRGANPLADKLAGLLPDDAAWTSLRNTLPQPAGAQGQIDGTGLFAPGRYPKGLKLSAGDTATLLPGTYLFGGNFSLSGHSQVLGTGVTLLLDSGVSGSVSGTGSLVLTPPLSGGLQGLLIMTHRSTSGTGFSFSGNGAITCEGTVYVPGASVTLSGNGAAQGLGQIVCRKLKQTGNANISGRHIVPAEGTGGTTALVQ